MWKRLRTDRRKRKGPLQLKNDGGYSLLELVVTIAILATVGTGISALMVTGTRLYSAQSASVRLQSKAQILTAQLRNTYLSAEEEMLYAEDIFLYRAGEQLNGILYDASTGRLYLTEDLTAEETEGMTVEKLVAAKRPAGEPPLLADHVTAFSIELPVSETSGTRNEVITAFTLEDHGSTYETRFVTALRGARITDSIPAGSQTP